MVKPVLKWVSGVLLTLLILFCLIMLGAVFTQAQAQVVEQRPNTPLEFKVCGDTTLLRFKRNGIDMDVYCVGESTPVFTLKGCTNAKVTRVGANYKVICTAWIPHKITPIAPRGPTV